MRTLLFALALIGLVPATLPAQPSLLTTLEVLRAEYPTPLSPTQLGELLTRAAQSAPGWVLLAKPQGANCPAMGTRVSCDHLVFAPTGQGFDVLRDAEGLAVPMWSQGDVFGPERYVAVGAPDPPPPPGPEPAPPRPEDLTALLALLADLEQHLAHLQAAQTADTAAIRADLAAHAQAVTPPPPPAPAPAPPEADPKSWLRRWVMERVVPYVISAVGGWVATR